QRFDSENKIRCNFSANLKIFTKTPRSSFCPTLLRMSNQDNCEPLNRIHDVFCNSFHEWYKYLRNFRCKNTNPFNYEAKSFIDEFASFPIK
ncbi:hypothetical protein BpHYR1_039268, partial [Brachionus plicatilis]